MMILSIPLSWEKKQMLTSAGFKWETALVKLSCAELAVYCFEHLLSAGLWAACGPVATVGADRASY